MTDLKTLILVIEQRISIAERNNQAFVDLPYDTVGDALAMLKEQQQQIWELQDQVEYLTDKLKEQEAEPEIEGGGSTWWYVCSECRGAIDDSDRYCRHCGARMKGR